jgi:general secretion pathway protein B
MSILLDALKKSETQRTLGQTPGIHTAVDDPNANGATGQQWVPLSMLALGAIAIAWFGWQQYLEPPTPAVSSAASASAATASPAEPPPEVPSAGGPSMNPDASQQQIVEAKKPALNKEQIKARPNNGGDAKKVAATPASGTQEAETRKQNLNKSFADYEAGDEPQTRVGKQPRAPSITKNRRATMPAGTSAGQEPASQATVKSQARAPARVEPAASEPISFWLVPQALRDGLPEIRITVLVYAEASEDRFVLINGQRLVEKEELAPGVVLDEIRRDGAVFSYRKYRFLVKG